MQIWALFSIDNNYDQPENNLVGFWEKRPGHWRIRKTLESVGTFYSTSALDDATNKVYSLKRARDSIHTEFRLELVEAFDE